MLSIIWNINPFYILLMVAEIIIGAVAVFPAIIFPRYIIDSLIDGRELSHVLSLIAAMILSGLFFSLLSIFLSNKREQMSLILTFTINRDICKKCLDIDYEQCGDARVMDKLYTAGRIVNDNNFGALLASVRTFFTGIFILFGIIALTITIDAIVILLAIAVIIVQTVLTSKTAKKQLDFNTKSYPYMRRSEYIGRMSYHISFRKDILLYKAKNYVANKINNYHKTLLEFFRKLARFNIISQSLGTLTANAYQFAMYLFLSVRALARVITIGDFTLFLNALNNFVSSSNNVISSVIDIRQRIQYFVIYQEFMNLESKQEKGVLPLNLPKEYTIKFENVSFAYPGKSEFALKNVNLEIKSGANLAIVGKNGAGKSTFILLLMRLYDPTEGAIYLNGINIKEIKYDEYLGMFGTVFQDFSIFAYSVFENITFREGDSSEDENIKRLLKENEMNAVIDRMKNGIDTYLGRELDEEGEYLSGGELQKIAIIRAIYKNAPFLIMDEPNSSLDPIAEYNLYCKFADMTKGKTAIYISHRLTSIGFCDKVILFEDGKVAEYGTHKELMENDGVYSQMYTLQMGLYEQKP